MRRGAIQVIVGMVIMVVVIMFLLTSFGCSERADTIDNVVDVTSEYITYKDNSGTIRITPFLANAPDFTKFVHPGDAVSLSYTCDMQTCYYLGMRILKAGS